LAIGLISKRFVRIFTMEGECPLMCMWSYAASTMPVAGIFGRILGRYLARGQAYWYPVGHCGDATQDPA
jgi:hypothetical protein